MEKLLTLCLVLSGFQGRTYDLKQTKKNKRML